MTDLRKAAEMALEALSEYTGVVTSGTDPTKWDEVVDGGGPAREAIQALRQALAQPEQEPVVGMFEEKLPDQNPPPWSRSYRLKRDWVGLTDEEYDELMISGDWGGSLIQATEAKLKEKNT